MASSLQGFVDAVKTNLNARLAATYPQGIACLIDDDGNRETAEHQNTPSITFRYTTGEGGPPKRAGGNPRTLWMRNMRIETKIWGDNFELAEQLYVNLGRTMWELAHGSVGLISETWAEHGAGTKGSQVIVVWGPFLLPLTEAAVETSTATTVTHRSALAGSAENCGHEEDP